MTDEERRACRLAAYVRYRAKHPEAVRARGRVASKVFHATHRTEVLAANKVRYAANRMSLLAQQKARRLAHLEDARAKDKARWAANREKRSAEKRAHYAAHCEEMRIRSSARRVDVEYRERARAKTAVWRVANPGRSRATCKAWQQANRGVVAAIASKHRASKRRAQPVWADEAAIRAIYREAALLTKVTSIKHDVDHFYPLQGKTVCGLHVFANLRIMTHIENVRKGNKHPAQVAA